MKCKVCGAYNEDYMEYCENCAALLVPEEQNAVKPSAQSSAKPVGTRTSWGFAKAPEWPSPDFDFETVSEQDVPAEFVERVSQTFEADYSEPEESQQSFQQPASSRFAAPEDPFASSAFADDEKAVKFADPIDDYNFYSYDEHSGKGKRSGNGKKQQSGSSYPAATRRGSRKLNKRALIFYGAAGILVIAIIVLALVFFLGGKDKPSDPQTAETQTPAEDASAVQSGGKKQSAFSMFFDSLFGKSVLTKPATIEKDTSTDEVAYFITVYAKKDCTVVFTAGSLTSENPCTEGSVRLRVPEQVWIPGEPAQSSTLMITPDVVVVDAEGNRTTVPFDEQIAIELPTLALNVTTPATAAVTSDTGIVDIAGTVDNNTAEVWANDMQLAVDADGNFTGAYTLTAAGTQDVVIEARKSGYAIASTTLSVDFSADAAAGTPGATGGTTGDTGTPSFAFDAELERRTTEATITVKGTCEAGATLTVSGVELNGTVTTDETAGTFQFTVSMADVGLYTATVKSVKNGIEGTRTIYLERSHADKNAYMEGTHALDYQYLLDAPFHDKSYTIYGKVVEIIESDAYHTVARLTTDAGDVIMCYYGSTVTVEANDGKTYAVYSDPYGRYDLNGSTVPQVYAWYIKKS